MWESHLHNLNELLQAKSCRVQTQLSYECGALSEDRWRRSCESDDGLVPCSTLSWYEVDDAYSDCLQMPATSIPTASIGQDTLSNLLAQLQQVSRAEGAPNINQPKARSESSVHIILRSVVLTLNESVPLLRRKVEFEAPAVLAKGVADFVVERGNTKLLVVVPEEDHPRSAAEVHVMMDMAISKSKEKGKPCDHIYGLVTNFHRWEFVKYNGIERSTCTEYIRDNNNQDELEKIASRLYGILQS